MADTRPIIFGPGDKLRWLEGIAFDEFATPFDCKVGIALTNRVDKHTGVAIVSQTWIAEKVGASERGVRQSLERLRARRDLDIVHSRGRGLANQYRLLKSGTLVPLFEAEKRNGATLKEERRDIKRGTGVPPLPNSTTKISSYAARTGGSAVDASPHARQWQSIKEGLAKHPSVGDDAWVFDKLTVQFITDTEVVMIAPSTFVRHEIEKDVLHQRLTAAWRAELPTITRVQLVTSPVARATE